MTGSNSQLGVTVVGKDEITPVLKKVEKNTRSMGAEFQKVQKHTSALDRTFGSLGARIKTGFQMHVINAGLGLMDRTLRNLVDVFPDLIARGERWFTTVDSIVDITGMAASKASELAAVAENVGVSSEGLSRMMNALAKAVYSNADQFEDYGVRIKDNNGHLLDSYTIFQNVRQRISQMGASLQSARLSQMAFGRASLESADLLTLTNAEWAKQAKLAKESGLIVGDAANAAVEAWGRAKSVLDQSINGIGTQILGGIAPTLVQLTSAVTKTTTANMGNIVRFTSGAAVAIANIIGGLLGVDFDPLVSFETGSEKSEKAAAKLRRAIDDMNNANAKSAPVSKAASNALKEQARLEDELEQARRRLAAKKNSSVFTANMSTADAILAKQRQQAAVKEARERVSDAQKALGEHAKAMTAMTGVVKAENAKVRMDNGKTYGGKGDKGTIIEGLEQTVKDAASFGRQIADSIKDALFGPDTTQMVIPGVTVTTRSGGLFALLQKAAAGMVELAVQVGRLVDFLTPPELLTPEQKKTTATVVEIVATPGFGEILWNQFWNGRPDGTIVVPPKGTTVTSTVNRSGHESPVKPRQVDPTEGGVGDYQPGLGLRIDPLAGIRALGDIERSLGVGGALPDSMSRVEQAVYAVEAAIAGLPAALDTGGGTGGTGGSSRLADRVGTLESRVDTISRRNIAQDDRMDGLQNVNASQGRSITKAMSVAKVGQVFRNQWHKSLPQAINSYDARLDRIESRLGIGNPDRQAPARSLRGGDTVRLVLDQRETRRLFVKGIATTSLKPV